MNRNTTYIIVKNSCVFPKLLTVLLIQPIKLYDIDCCKLQSEYNIYNEKYCIIHIHIHVEIKNTNLQHVY